MAAPLLLFFFKMVTMIMFVIYIYIFFFFICQAIGITYYLLIFNYIITTFSCYVCKAALKQSVKKKKKKRLFSSHLFTCPLWFNHFWRTYCSYCNYTIFALTDTFTTDPYIFSSSLCAVWIKTSSCAGERKVSLLLPEDYGINSKLNG